MIPLMPWLAKMTQYQAHGTSLVAIIFAAFVGGMMLIAFVAGFVPGMMGFSYWIAH